MLCLLKFPVVGLAAKSPSRGREGLIETVMAFSGLEAARSLVRDLRDLNALLSTFLQFVRFHRENVLSPPPFGMCVVM